MLIVWGRMESPHALKKYALRWYRGIIILCHENLGLKYESGLWPRMIKVRYLALVVEWDVAFALHMYTWRWHGKYFTWVWRINGWSMSLCMIYVDLLWYDPYVMFKLLSVMIMLCIDKPFRLYYVLYVSFHTLYISY